jgi:hypothetical protein
MSARWLAVIGVGLIVVCIIDVPSIFADPVDPAVSFVFGTVLFWAGIVMLVVSWRRRGA